VCGLRQTAALARRMNAVSCAWLGSDGAHLERFHEYIREIVSG